MKKVLFLLILVLSSQNTFPNLKKGSRLWKCLYGTAKPPCSKKETNQARRQAALTTLGPAGPVGAGIIVGTSFLVPRKKPVPYRPAKAIESAKVPVTQLISVKGYGLSNEETARKIFNNEANIANPTMNEINLLLASIRGDVAMVKQLVDTASDIRQAAKDLAKNWITNKDDSTAAYFEIKNILLR